MAQLKNKQRIPFFQITWSVTCFGATITWNFNWHWSRASKQTGGTHQEGLRKMGGISQEGLSEWVGFLRTLTLTLQ